MIGTGFWFLGEAVHAPTDVRGDEAIRIDNQLDVMSKTFLGLTISCARCHDHKFDPISTADYYGLTGYLRSSRRQEAMLDPHGRIRAVAGSLRELRHEGDRSLQKSATAGRLDGDALAAWLQAAGEVLARGPGGENPAGEVLRDAAARHGVEPQTLARWIKAVSDPVVGQPSHPLYAWMQLAAAGSQEIAARRQRLDQDLTAQAKAARERLARSELFADFRAGGLDGWFVTGEAFDPQPTGCGQWDAAARRDRLIESGVVHSGLTSPRLHGVLRSPTFTITQPTIQYRLNAKGAQIRLVIDGYFMASFHGLLFGGLALNNLDTGGKFAWQSQGGDLGNYLGHTAYIEIIDAGDGFAAVDEIRFSDGTVPQDGVHPWNLAAAADPGTASAGDLARWYGRAWEQCLEDWAAGRLDAAQIEMINRLLDQGLLVPEPVTADLAARLGRLEADLPPPTYVLAMTDGTGEDDRLHFRDHGWSLKHTIRQLVNSRTYRMSSVVEGSNAAAQADPGNRWWHRMPVRRLPAESIRDALLAVSGRLDRTLYGPSVPIHLTPFMEGRGRPADGPLDGDGRRSIYVEVRRNFLSPLMLAFDMPIPFSAMGARSVSNVPAQSLILMNDPLVIDQSQRWAQRLLSEYPDPQRRIVAAFESALGRGPTEVQRQRVDEFLDAQAARYGAGPGDLRVWADLCHTLFNMKEFTFLD